MLDRALRFPKPSGAPAQTVQHRKVADATADVHATAGAGLAGSGGALPHADTIQHAFGRHDVGGIVAHTDSAAQTANENMGSLGYASGQHVAFRGAPDLFTAAHEAAHTIQQQSGGVQLRGGVGQAGDTHEQHADAVAARVVSGRSAEDLLDRYTGGTASAGVQRRGASIQHQRPAATPARAEGAPPAQAAPASGQTTEGAARTEPATPAAPGTERPGARGGPASAETIRAAHPNGMTVALAVAPTFVDQAEAETNRTQEDRRDAISRIDPALWGDVTRQWCNGHPREMDQWAAELNAAGGANQWTTAERAARTRLYTQIARAKQAEIRLALSNDETIWRSLNRRTVSQGAEFTGQARAFANAHQGVAVDGGQMVLGRHMTYENQGDLTGKINAVASAAGAAGLHENQAKIRRVGIFTHGWAGGIASRHGQRAISDPAAVVRSIDSALTGDVHVALFACGTAGRAGDNVENTFADRLRDALSQNHSEAVVMGHQNSGHTVANENVRLLGANGQNEGASNPLTLIDSDLRRESRPAVEAAFQRAHPSWAFETQAYNRAVIYWYNREFSLQVTAAATRDPAVMRREAAAWWRSFAGSGAERIATTVASKTSPAGRRGERGAGMRRRARPESVAEST